MRKRILALMMAAATLFTTMPQTVYAKESFVPDSQSANTEMTTVVELNEEKPLTIDVGEGAEAAGSKVLESIVEEQGDLQEEVSVEGVTSESKEITSDDSVAEDVIEDVIEDVTSEDTTLEEGASDKITLEDIETEDIDEAGISSKEDSLEEITESDQEEETSEELPSEEALTEEVAGETSEEETVLEDEEIAENWGETGTVSRIEWWMSLIDTFDMSVDAANYPDNYYADLSEDYKYYHEVMVATEFGLVDVEAGEMLRPEDPVTRQLAAMDMNVCLAFQLEDATYTFKEASEVADPVAIQIAINKGWIKTNSSGYFLPDSYITPAQKGMMIEAAASILAASQFSDSHENAYKFKGSVIVLPEDAVVEMTDFDQYTITNCTTDLKVGDTFAFIKGDLPIVHKVVNVTKSGTTLKVTTESVEMSDTFASLDVEGSEDISLASVQAVDDSVALSYIVGGTAENDWEDGVKYNSLEEVGEQEISAIEAAKTYDISDEVRKEFNLATGVKATVSCKISNVSESHKIDYWKKYAYLKINATATFTANVSMDVLEAAGISKNVKLVRVPVYEIGFIDVLLNLSLKGEVSAVFVEDVSMGVEYSVGSGMRMTKSFTKRSFTLEAKAEAMAGITLEAGVDCGFVKGSIYAQTGVKARASIKRYTDGKKPTTCAQVDAWWFVTVGCKLKVDVFIYKNEWKKEYEIYNLSNSPVKVSMHFEDKKRVSYCTRNGSTPQVGPGTDSKGNTTYNTPGDSKYTPSSGNNILGKDQKPYVAFEYDVDDDNNAIITLYKGTASYVNVPGTLDGHKVVAIGERAFWNNRNLYMVTIPSTVLEIGNDAFSACSNLANVIIYPGVTHIGNSAFTRCYSLTSIVLPDTVTDIDAYAFQNCTRLASVTLSKGLVELGYHAFANDDLITKIQIPKSLDVASWSFDGCSGLKTVTFETGTQEVSNSLFAGCDGLESITIPNTVIRIENDAFNKCQNLKKVSLPDTVVSIGNSAFAECKNLPAIVIPDSVTHIDAYAFQNCAKLANVTLSKGLIELGYHAFRNDDLITKIQIPKSLDEASWSFDGCSGLKTVTFETGTQEVSNSLFAGCDGLQSITIPNTVVRIENDAFNNCQYLTKVSISDTVVSIGNSAFANCKRLPAIVIPDSVTHIDAYAFQECAKLANVTLSKGLIELGYHAFRNDDLITEILIPKSLNQGSWSFDGCSGLKTVTFEKGTEEVSNSLFAGCDGLESITIPNTVLRIEDSAFNNCKNLKTVAVSTKATSIGNSTFAGCEKLEKITIPSSVKIIEAYAFQDCHDLTEVSLTEGLTSIGYRAFAKCFSLQALVLPNSLTKMDSCAFQNCTSMTTATLPSSMTKLPYGTFEGCTNLAKVNLSQDMTVIEGRGFYGCGFTVLTLPETVTKLEGGVYANCDALTKVTLPNSITSIGGSCFEGCDALTTVNLSTALTTIPEKAFFECTSLNNVVVPYRVTTIGNQAFANSTKLLAITIPRATTSIASNAFSYYSKMTFYGVKGTTTETFAKEKGSRFVAKEVPATEVTLNKTKLTLRKGQTEKLQINIVPANFTDEVAWRTSDVSIATIKEDGTVTAIGVGTATIKLIVGDTVVSCAVTVVQPVTGINLNTYSHRMEARDTLQLTATVYPENAKNQNVTWSSSDATVAKVTRTGLVTGLKKGTATIYATAADGSGVKRACTITVTNDVIFCTDPTQLESAHKYAANSDITWMYTLSGATGLDVTFDERTEFDDMDFLYIYTGDKTLVGKYTGTQLAGKTITVNSDTVRLKLTSDNVLNMWGFKVTSVEEKHTHVRVADKAVAATCTRDGLTKGYHCSLCGEVLTKQKVVPATGHTEVIDKAVAATCTKTGLTKGSHCSVCNEVIIAQKKVAKKAHTYEAGYCTVCGAEDPIPQDPTMVKTSVYGGVSVTFDTLTKDARIYYGTKEAITTSNKYVTGGTVKTYTNYSGDLYAKAYKNGKWSNVVKISIKPSTCAKPTITQSRNVATLTTSTADCQIWYTTDGTDPVVKTDGTSTNATRLTTTSTGKFTVLKDMTIKAIAVKKGRFNSAVASFSAKAIIMAAPSFKVVGVIGGRNVTFNSTDPDVVIYYSTSTSSLTTKDKKVKNGETVLFTNYYGTIYAKAYLNGQWSNVSRLILKIPVVNTPTITALGAGKVKITTTTPSCQIYYTIDGTTPSPTNGKKISASNAEVYVGAGKTVKAIAVRSCFTNSNVATGKSN